MRIYFFLLILSLMYSADTQAQEIRGRFAIQHVQTGKNLRPFEARVANNNKIVLYNHHSWKCMTWEFLQVAGETYQLQNRYTHKTFQPAGKPEPGVGLYQQPVEIDALQHWEFIKQPDKTYLIRLHGSGLYLAISSEKTNSAIILTARQHAIDNKWKLVKQDPWF